jgi:hypothetical protein
VTTAAHRGPQKALVVVTLLLAILLFAVAATPARAIRSPRLAWTVGSHAAAINFAALLLLGLAAIEYVVVRLAL